MAEAQTFYFVAQGGVDNAITITRIARARVFTTALAKAFQMCPVGTRSFMVVEEMQLQKLAEDIRTATRHKIGEK